MSGNFVRERQRIVYIYNIHVYYICKQYVAARARNFQTFLGRLCMHKAVTICSSNFACLQYFKLFTTSTSGLKPKEYMHYNHVKYWRFSEYHKV